MKSIEEELKELERTVEWLEKYVKNMEEEKKCKQS